MESSYSEYILLHS